MNNVSPLLRRVQALETALSDSKSSSIGLKGGGDGPTIEGMSDFGLHTRLSRLEGGNATLQWSVGIVSAALLGVAAIVIGLQLYTLTRVGSVEQQVQALPGEINRNLLELNRTLSDSITAARGQPSAPPQPIIIYQQPPQAMQPPP